ncbi:hypothetical protein PAECIP111893_01029 [Paenibacillus plantiphilus]|uniref:UPF0102 protein PAECIP111893_01029 n=1 Tax=Paenibacillus plantiphilus TaxID=2905650 RepID=A0ABN8G337_9BACL|nr:YraN family protein [Paenibacillus plantiphilus]CAH1197869.1 hypothetical protein PAECIP111893_01029 [Paenibacillus plantiphilus]
MNTGSERTDRRRLLGRRGEDAAVERLISLGYHISDRNWRCRSGELDIVASYNGIVVFIEVRTRTEGGRFGTAAESVDLRKQHQVIATSQVYMLANKLSQAAAIRFDVMAVTIERSSDQIIAINHIEGAF